MSVTPEMIKRLKQRLARYSYAMWNRPSSEARQMMNRCIDEWVKAEKKRKSR